MHSSARACADKQSCGVHGYLYAPTVAGDGASAAVVVVAEETKFTCEGLVFRRASQRRVHARRQLVGRGPAAPEKLTGSVTQSDTAAAFCSTEVPAPSATRLPVI